MKQRLQLAGQSPGAGFAQVAMAALWLCAVVLAAGADPLRWAFAALPLLARILASAALLYILPGLVILNWLWPDTPRPVMERLILAAAVGSALPPILLELASMLSLPWTPWVTRLYVLAALLAFLSPWMRTQLARLLRSQNGERDASSLAFAHRLWPATAGAARRAMPALSWNTFWMLGLTALALWARLYIVRDLPAGLWGDSYHHTMITQLLANNRGLFTSWLPFAPLATFTYHFGFHANAVFFHWLSGLPVTQSVVIVGQLLNAAAVPLVYLLSARLTGSRTVALWAALLTGFFNMQPAFYVNWGRYTQLTGQVLLPAAVVGWLQVLGEERVRLRGLLLPVLLMSSLMLTHYIATIFAALWLAAYLILRVVREPHWRVVWQLARRVGAVLALSLLLVSPWLANTLGGFLVRNIAGFVNGSVGAQRIAEYAQLPPMAALYLKPYILALAGLGLLLGMARRQWGLLSLAGWFALLLLSMAPQVLGLPGVGIINYFTVYIMLYLPTVPLAAFALAQGQAALRQWQPRLAALAAAGGLLAASIFGFVWNSRLLDLNHQLITNEDVRAFEWLKANLPPEGRVFVNSFPAYGGTLIVGSDGGWWLPLLAGRQTNLPPTTYGSERGIEDGFAARVNDLAAALRGHPLTTTTPVAIDLSTPANITLLRAEGFRYVYIGAHAAPGPETADHIDVAALRANPGLFNLLYEEAGVLIFEIGPTP